MYLTPQTAARLKERIHLCEDLRKLLIICSSDCDSTIHLCSKSVGLKSMPDWWIPGDFDVALCHAAYRVGLQGLPQKISLDRSLIWVMETFKNFLTLFPATDILIDRIRSVVGSCRASYESRNCWPRTSTQLGSSLVNISSQVQNRYIIYRMKGQVILPVNLL
jgi:hypothetical protein